MAASLCTMKSFTPEKALELIKRHFECCTLKSTMGDEDGSDYKTHIQVSASPSALPSAHRAPSNCTSNCLPSASDECLALALLTDGLVMAV